MVKMPHWPIPYGKKTIDLDLSRIKALLNNLGNPHKKLPPIIHVAGTNGKGSTIAYIRAILEAAGYIVHCYTSPHLVRFNERIVVAGKEINDNFLYSILEECRVASQDLPLTFFEGTTAAAFLAFSKIKADVVLLEVGLGGRLDATNVIDSPMLSIITPISLDHMEYLGHDVCQIASEKAGIIKRGSMCIIGWQEDAVLQTLQYFCKEHKASYFSCREHWNFQKTDNGFLLCLQDEILELPTPSLIGVHQIMNAACAVAAIINIKHLYSISISSIRIGLQKAIWPARLQLIKSGVLSDLIPDGSELWVDGAHNISGAQMLELSISQLHDQSKVLYIINGRTKQRDVEGFLRPFCGKVKMLCAVSVQSEPMSEPAENITRIALGMGFNAVTCNDIRDAILRCLKDANSQRCRIIICGSLYLAGDLLLANTL